MAVEGAPSYAELQHRLARAERELAEAREREVGVLEWQTATSEILRVIASSPTDLAGVLDSIIQSAARLTGANYAAVLQAEGNVLRISATLAPETSPVGFAQPFDRGSVNGRVLLDGVTIHEFSPAAGHLAVYPNSHMIDVGFRVQLVTPLLREGVPIGTLLVARRAWVPFTDRQVQLLETFADQAVIAIENTRLFTELQARNHDLGEALEQQTATAEILGIISRSPTELQSVMDAVVERAARLCEASGAAISLLDGDVLKSTARYGSFSRAYEASPDYRGMARPVSRDWPTGRAVVDRQTIHIPDLEAANEAEFPLTGRFVQQHGHRSAIFTPLLREDAAIGTLAVCRQQVGPFTERQIEVLKIFADQAVIAIENARLFAELEDRNRDLGEALERQTATAEILRVIASSPTDLPAVLDAVVRSAAELCEAAGASVLLVEDDVLRVAATYGTLREAYVASAELRGLARPINREWVSGRAVVDREVLHIHDLVAAARDEFPGSRAFAERHGHRSTLYVPLLREDEAIGVLALARPEVRPFTDQQIDLVRTFADQAVIGIANTRLFRELAGRVEELKALGEVGQGRQRQPEPAGGSRYGPHPRRPALRDRRRRAL